MGKFSIKILNPSNKDDTLHLEKAYACWFETWKDALENEINTDEKLFSDDFSRQDSILTIFDEDECVGLTFFRHVDFSLPWNAHDTYFKCWSLRNIEKLTARGKHVCVCSNFTISKKYRGKIDGLRMKDVLMYALTRYFVHSGADVMTGTMRLDKNMGNLTYEVGAIPLEREVVYPHGDKVDLVAFYRNECLHRLNERPCDFTEGLMSRYNSLYEAA